MEPKLQESLKESLTTIILTLVEEILNSIPPDQFFTQGLDVEEELIERDTVLRDLEEKFVPKQVDSLLLTLEKVGFHTPQDILARKEEMDKTISKHLKKMHGKIKKMIEDSG